MQSSQQGAPANPNSLAGGGTSDQVAAVVCCWEPEAIAPCDAAEAVSTGRFRAADVVTTCAR